MICKYIIMTSEVQILGGSKTLFAESKVSLHWVRSCSNSFRELSSRLWCMSCTSRSRKLVKPNSTSSRQSGKSTNRLCREFWAMSRSSSSIWIVSLVGTTKSTMIHLYHTYTHTHTHTHRETNKWIIILTVGLMLNAWSHTSSFQRLHPSQSGYTSKRSEVYFSSLLSLGFTL